MNAYEKKVKEEQAKARKEYTEAEIDYQKYHQFKLRIIYILLFLIIVLFIIAKIILGSININVGKYSYPRYYDITVNNMKINYDLVEDSRITIIPTFLYIHSYYNNPVKFENTTDYVNISRNDDIIIDIKGLICYINVNDRHNKTGCFRNKDNYIYEDADDITYTMDIYNNQDKTKPVYKGTFKSDITSYLDIGKYEINIYGKYKNVTSNITFWIEVK